MARHAMYVHGYAKNNHLKTEKKPLKIMEKSERKNEKGRKAEDQI